MSAKGDTWQFEADDNAQWRRVPDAADPLIKTRGEPPPATLRRAATPPFPGDAFCGESMGAIWRQKVAVGGVRRQFNERAGGEHDEGARAGRQPAKNRRSGRGGLGGVVAARLRDDSAGSVRYAAVWRHNMPSVVSPLIRRYTVGSLCPNIASSCAG